jgi:16S rRNA (guanine966-N2)-methyltransferase
MRIISGEFRSRRLASPPESLPTRPITDRVKEAVFNLLRGHFEDAYVVDCFAGSGTIGLEAISRGAAHCVFVEQSRVCAKTLAANIESLGVKDRSDVVISDALSPALPARFRQPPHVIFFDPPYAMTDDVEERARVLDQMARLAEHMDPSGFLILRTAWPLVDESLKHPRLVGPETHEYNSMAMHLYQPEPR